DGRDDVGIREVAAKSLPPASSTSATGDVNSGGVQLPGSRGCAPPRQLLDQFGAPFGAVVGGAPGGDLAGASGEAGVGEDPARRPAQGAGTAEPPGQREPGTGPGDPHRRLTH